MSEITTMKVKKAIRDRLKVLGRKGESYNDVITKLLDEMEKAKPKESVLFDESKKDESMDR